jgi:hypothetical protein
MRVTISFTVPCDVTTSDLLNHMHMDTALDLIARTAAEMLNESQQVHTYFDDMKLFHVLRPDDPLGNEPPVGEWLIEPEVTRYEPKLEKR